MKAEPGDKLVVRGHNVGAHDRIGIIVEVHGEDGEPPYVVEWSDAEGQHIFWPGSDAHIEKFEHHTQPSG
jgi:hypothetical protein